MSEPEQPPLARTGFQYDYDPAVFAQLQRYIAEKNAGGLALVSRQKGIPPFLRFWVWPAVLKHHPFVVTPFLQPDEERQSGEEEQVEGLVSKDVRRYFRRDASASPLSAPEMELADHVQHAVVRFVSKWRQVLRYDPALTWMALGLAEFVPPVPHTSLVLLGRNHPLCVGSVFAEYDDFIKEHNLAGYLESLLKETPLLFAETYERLALVLLHAPEAAMLPKRKINKLALSLHGGTLEERVLFFIHVLQRLLPDLLLCFAEENILNRFGLHDDQWVIWWLKYCGTKVWLRVDRGRVWDLMLGWRPQRRLLYVEKLGVAHELSAVLGPDPFWLVEEPPLDASELSAALLPLLALLLDLVPFSKIDPQVELVFVCLALLKAKEHLLVELDQHEIRAFLLRLPAKSLKRSDRYKQYQEQRDKKGGDRVREKPGELKHDYMESVINEAGELWRKWRWRELND